jgi:hypothetical protein
MEDAFEFAKDAIKEKFCNKAVVGLFVWDPSSEYLHISEIGSIGFKGDSKNINQLELFSHFKSNKS